MGIGLRNRAAQTVVAAPPLSPEQQAEADRQTMAVVKEASEASLVEARRRLGVALDGSEDHLTGGLAAEAARNEREFEAAKKQAANDNAKNENGDGRARTRATNDLPDEPYPTNDTKTDATGVATKFQNVNTTDEFKAAVEQLQGESKNRPNTNLQGYVGEGRECVDLVKGMVPDIPRASNWSQGSQMKSTGDPPISIGTPLAMFDKDGRYPLDPGSIKHAFVFGGYATEGGRDGYYVVEQFKGQEARSRFVAFDGDAGKSNPRYVGRNYSVIEWPGKKP